MDRAEAKDILNYDIRQYIKQCEDATDEDFEAIDLAIEALKESQTTHDQMDACYMAQKQVTSKSKNPDDSLLTEDSEACKEQKSKLDCISRQDAIEALMAHFIPQTYTGEQVEQAEKLAQKIMNKVPSVTPTVSEDCISKQTMLETLDRAEAEKGGVFETDSGRIRIVIEHTPPVTPTEHKTTETMIVDGMEMEIDSVSYEIGYSHGQVAPTERTGEWIVYPLKDEGRVELECPECGYALIRAADRRPHFCENCGAKMKGGTENDR